MPDFSNLHRMATAFWKQAGGLVLWMVDGVLLRLTQKRGGVEGTVLPRQPLPTLSAPLEDSRGWQSRPYSRYGWCRNCA